MSPRWTALGVRLRLFVKGLTPPFLWRALKAVKDRLRGRPQPAAVATPAPVAPPKSPQEPPEWEYVPEGWDRAGDARVRGWDVDAIAHAYRAKWPSYLRAIEGTGPLGVYHEVPLGQPIRADDLDAHNMILSYGYVLARVAHGKHALSLLDWGGGCGHYYPLSEALLPGVDIDYHCKDVPRLCALGHELLPEARFYDDDSCLDRRYDLVLVSGSLQYAVRWRETLQRLAAAAEGLLYVTRLPVAFHAPPFVVLQRAYRYGYETEYLGWVLNRAELVEEAGRAGLDLQRELLLGAKFAAAGAPEEPVGHRGFLFGRS